MPDQNIPQSNQPPQQPNLSPDGDFIQAPGPAFSENGELPPLQPQVPPQMNQADGLTPVKKRRAGRGTRVRLIILGILSGFFVLSLIVLFVFRGRTESIPVQTDPVAVPSATAPSPENTVAPITNTDAGNTQGEIVPIRDSDGDGLLDTEEVAAGTDTEKIDTDGDGLNDRQELRVYQTNPQNPDTDADGFTDGDEVRNFYDPNGPGKILDESQLIKELNDTP